MDVLWTWARRASLGLAIVALVCLAPAIFALAGCIKYCALDDNTFYKGQLRCTVGYQNEVFALLLELISLLLLVLAHGATAIESISRHILIVLLTIATNLLILSTRRHVSSIQSFPSGFNSKDFRQAAYSLAAGSNTVLCICNLLLIAIVGYAAARTEDLNPQHQSNKQRHAQTAYIKLTNMGPSKEG
eukprot:CAMPEP_0202897940 /NCGR_PEP_ID=MMETSP1392-20130828/6570_1 /ASSEMBLY_ACC=CAM_ASM_000868 /TAXON_ID=225041 /ORGANISM="Chlamydomonas chlamydogama, Strain SAG 11-48b" /LENGTH=187 /DNA_ID=CAMNT_0049583711 /DNA_START=53 /DNA_END=616 /DNA_ORIENTATION=-